MPNQNHTGEPTDHIDPETLADLLDGIIDGTTYEDLIDHLLGCRYCLKTLLMISGRLPWVRHIEDMEGDISPWAD